MIEATRRGPALYLTIDRPARANSLTVADWQKLRCLVEGGDAAPSVHVIVIQGAGTTHFSAGMDLDELRRAAGSPEAAELLTTSVTAALAVITTCGTPTLAAVNGAAVGGGAEIALAADIRIAASTAFLALPMATVGVAIDRGSLHNLVSLVGRGAAASLLLTGRTVDAAECRALGLFQAVVNQEELDARTGEFLAAIVAGHFPTQRQMMQLLAELAPRPAQSWREPMLSSLLGSAR